MLSIAGNSKKKKRGGEAQGRGGTGVRADENAPVWSSTGHRSMQELCFFLGGGVEPYQVALRGY